MRVHPLLISILSFAVLGARAGALLRIPARSGPEAGGSRCLNLQGARGHVEAAFLSQPPLLAVSRVTTVSRSGPVVRRPGRGGRCHLPAFSQLVPGSLVGSPFDRSEAKVRSTCAARLAGVGGTGEDAGAGVGLAAVADKAEDVGAEGAEWVTEWTGGGGGFLGELVEECIGVVKQSWELMDVPAPPLDHARVWSPGLEIRG